MHKKRAQGATEYLTILAVIIIIALLVIAVLSWFPGFSFGITANQSKSYWHDTTPLALLDWKITPSGATFLVFNNSLNKITLKDIEVDGTELGLSDVILNAGEEYTTPLDNSKTCESGEKYSYHVEITYTVNNGIEDKKIIGIKPIVGICE